MNATQTPTQEQLLLSWQAPIHATHERSMRWYIGGGVAVLALAVYGILSGAWTLTIVIVLIAAMYFLLRDHKFPSATIAITDKAAHINENTLPWQECKGYWIVTTPTYSELRLEPKTRRIPLVIQTGTMDLQTVRETLNAHIPELSEKRERMVDAFIRITKL